MGLTTDLKLAIELARPGWDSISHDKKFILSLGWMFSACVAGWLLSLMLPLKIASIAMFVWILVIIGANVIELRVTDKSSTERVQSLKSINLKKLRRVQKLKRVGLLAMIGSLFGILCMLLML